MTKIGYAAMLEQFHPTDLLDWCAQAETAAITRGSSVAGAPGYGSARSARSTIATSRSAIPRWG